MICEKCGFEFEDAKCPVCEGVDISDIDTLFKEEKIDINFNLKTIVNDVDYRNEYQNVEVKDADEKFQYKGKDLTDTNIKRLHEINDFYLSRLTRYKTGTKKLLETFDVPKLQALVASLNEVVNKCSRFMKMTGNAELKKKFKNTIKLYNAEIHYVKKYFILPLYDTPGLLNRSKIVKCLLVIVSVLLVYIIMSLKHNGVYLLNPLYKMVDWWTQAYPPHFSLETKAFVVMNALSISASPFIANVFFDIFLSITIKNKNFLVDKGKKYEKLIAFYLLSIVLSILNIYLLYGFYAAFIFYLMFFPFKCLAVKKWNTESIIEKVLCFVISFIIIILSMGPFINLIHMTYGLK